MSFQLHAPFTPAGDQPEAIPPTDGSVLPAKTQTLLGVTGGGKTFTMGQHCYKIRNGLPGDHA